MVYWTASLNSFLWNNEIFGIINSYYPNVLTGKFTVISCINLCSIKSNNELEIDFKWDFMAHTHAITNLHASAPLDLVIILINKPAHYAMCIVSAQMCVRKKLWQPRTDVINAVNVAVGECIAMKTRIKTGTGSPIGMQASVNDCEWAHTAVVSVKMHVRVVKCEWLKYISLQTLCSE